MKNKYIVLLLTCLVHPFSSKAQLTIDGFTGAYECTRYEVGGIHMTANLLIWPASNGIPTEFNIHDPNVYGGTWTRYGYLNQDSTFELSFYNNYGHFFGDDSIYVQYYSHHWSGDDWYFYYGRRVSVGIEQTLRITEPIEFIYNPAFNNIQIINNLNTCEIQCDLFTIAGIKSISESIYSSLGETKTIDLPPLPAGVYFIRLAGGGTTRTGKIIVP